jgi:hypothetical protein
MREMTNAYKIFVGKPKGKRSLRRHRHRWENNIKMVHKKIKLCIGVISIQKESTVYIHTYFMFNRTATR